MKVTTLQAKTIRPGNLNGFSYYYSRRPSAAKKTAKKTSSGKRHYRLFGLGLLIIIIAATIGYILQSHKSANSLTTFTQVPSQSTGLSNASPLSKPANTVPAATASTASVCTGNSLSQLIKVSISQRHLWACQAGKLLYDSPVITGIAYLAADTTPTGTYHIYAKETNVTLTGSDSTGSWSDPVSYWMPFLSNQYGVYGFHDATWRASGDFGNISPDSANASHGCVELPLATAAWLFNWSRIGTTLTIVS